MIEVQHDGNVAAQFLGILYAALGHITEDSLVGILAGTAGYLQDDRGLGLHTGLDDGLHLFHVVEVEGGNSIAAVDGLLEELS